MDLTGPAGPTQDAYDHAAAAAFPSIPPTMSVGEIERRIKWAVDTVWPMARAQLLTEITGVEPGDPPPTGGRPDSPVGLCLPILPTLARDLRESATIMDHWAGEEYRQFANAIDRFLAGSTGAVAGPRTMVPWFTADPGASGSTPETTSESSPTNGPAGSAG